MHLVALDQRVREQLRAHLVELFPCFMGILGSELDVDEAADARGRDLEAEMSKRCFDGLPLRIEDARLWPNEDGCPHASTTLGLATYASKEISVSRSNASM